MKRQQPQRQTTDLAPVNIPTDYNYIAVFLTLNCNLRCSYCINRFGELDRARPLLSAADWLIGLNRIISRTDLPVTLQGGEPSLHPGFYELINGLRHDLNIDLLTNLQFNEERFMAEVKASRLQRQAPYASIRVSYHPETMKITELAPRVARMLDHGYSVGIWAVDHPARGREIEEAAEVCREMGIDFRLKEFLGQYNGKEYGTYRYENAVNGRPDLVGQKVECRTTELLIGPQGDIYRCHSDLYAGRDPIGHILDPDFQIDDLFRPCFHFGACNPCDVKTKTNRFQQFGHTSVEIRTVDGESAVRQNL